MSAATDALTGLSLQKQKHSYFKKIYDVPLLLPVAFKIQALPLFPETAPYFRAHKNDYLLDTSQNKSKNPPA